MIPTVSGDSGRTTERLLFTLLPWFAVMWPLLTAVIVTLVGWTRIGYDPAWQSVSQLAVGSDSAAVVVDATIALLGIALIGLGAALRRTDRSQSFAALLLGAAGLSLLVAAVVKRDPHDPVRLGLHRGFVAIALISLALAPLAFSRHERAGGSALRLWSLTAGALLSTALLLSPLLLRIHRFPAGAFERTVFGIALAWVVTVAYQLVGNRSSRTA